MRPKPGYLCERSEKRTVETNLATVPSVRLSLASYLLATSAPLRNFISAALNSAAFSS